MGKLSMNLQDSFLNQVRKDGGDVRLVLLDGTEIKGQIRGFDNFTLIVATKGTQTLVYKHAIAQMICPRSMGSRDRGAPASNAPARDGAKAPRDDAKAPRDGAKAAPSEQKESGFNTIDLSQVKLESAAKPESAEPDPAKAE